MTPPRHRERATRPSLVMNARATIGDGPIQEIVISALRKLWHGSAADNRILHGKSRGPRTRRLRTMAQRPAVFVTRKLPEAVTVRLTRDYQATLNPDDRPIDGTELVAEAAGHDALLVSSRESLTAQTLAALPTSIRAIATFSVGFEHIDLAAAKARGLIVTNTPDVLTD